MAEVGVLEMEAVVLREGGGGAVWALAVLGLGDSGTLIAVAWSSFGRYAVVAVQMSCEMRAIGAACISKPGIIHF